MAEYSELVLSGLYCEECGCMIDGAQPGHPRNCSGCAKTKDRMFYFEVLKTDECRCGSLKASRKAFCYRCFKSLPRDMQRDLYKRIGQGFEEAYDAAIHYFSD